MPFSRLKQLIGESRFETLSTKTVCIVGLGGVGGSAAEAIARSGFGKILLVDQDIIEKSNINRQIVALQSTIGMPKVDVMKERILDINPDCQVDTLHMFYNETTKDKLWQQPIDFIIDAIDTITYKIDLVQEAFQRNIPIISVMGTGNKYCPEQLDIMPLSETSYDPIARVMRQKLKHRLPLQQIMVVASKEPPTKVDSMTMSPSSNAFVPNTAGILAANYIFLQAIGKTT
jgi:tRNA A37 threonylcarbamoyladenosine dehydratase